MKKCVDNDAAKDFMGFRTKNAQKYECSECTLKFVREKNIYRHIKSAHDGNATVKIAPEFEQENDSDQDLTGNVEVKIEEAPGIINLDDKKFKCKVCDKEFPKQKSYAAHMTKHIDPNTRGQKEFPCTVCDKVFNRRKNLSQVSLFFNKEAFVKLFMSFIFFSIF